MNRLNIVILAAGKGERMRSSKPKVMHEIMGKPMIGYVVDLAKSLSPASITAVLGFGRETVRRYLDGSGVNYSIQEEQKGTAHALLTAEEHIGDGDVLVLYGDVPMTDESTLRGLLDAYAAQPFITFMTTDVDDPRGYGRVLERNGSIEKIVEDADATPEEKLVKRINTGICVIPAAMMPRVRSINAANKKGEYYLTDICAVARAEGIEVRSYHCPDPREVLGVNSRRELLEAQLIMKERILGRHLSLGVTLLDTNIYIGPDVSIGIDTVIWPNCYISGRTVIGENVTIGPNAIIRDSRIASHAKVDAFTVMEGAEVGERVTVGPFARVRPTTVILDGARIGNFVEVKNSRVAEGAKASHLSYIGDSEIGRDVNVGAGTITCNYDGKKKHRTIIGDNVFIGSNTALVAPVEVGRDSIIGAGSTITKNVPEGSLAVTRASQRTIEGYGRKKRCAE